MASAAKVIVTAVEDGFSPELILLLAAAQHVVAGERKSACILSDVRWEELLHLAELHGLEPMLAKTLRGAGASAPGDFWQALNRSCSEIAGRNLALGKELIRVSAHLRNRHINHLVFKGPLLGQMLYETVSLRPSRDIDLLVRPQQTEAAFAALAEIGFEDKDRLDHHQRVASIRFSSEQCFAKAGIEVDLHWRLVPRHVERSLDDQVMWERATAAKLFDAFLPTLAPEDNFVALCLHAGEHAWSQISLFCDLAQLLAMTSNFDWEIVRQQTRDANVRRTVDVCTLLLAKYFHSEIPEDFLRREMQVELLAARAATEFWPDPERSPHRNDTSITWIRERCRGLRLRDRVRWITGVLLTPSLADFQALRLPGFLQGLYPALRFARLLLRRK